MRKKLNVLDVPYKTPIITKGTLKVTTSHPRFFRGHVRTSLGKLYTNEEFKERSNNILAKELP